MANEGHIITPDAGSLHKVMDTLAREASVIAGHAAEMKRDLAEAKEAAVRAGALETQIREIETKFAAEAAKTAEAMARVEKLQARCDTLDKQQTRSSVLDTKEYVAGFGPLSSRQREGVTRFGQHVEDRIRHAVGDRPRHGTMEGLSLSRDQVEGTAAAGGNVVPTPIMTDIQWLRSQFGTIRRDSTVIQMTSMTLQVPTSVTGPTVSYPGELNAPAAVTINVTDPNPKLQAKKCVITDKVSLELKEDTPPQYMDFIVERIFEAMGLEEDRVGLVTNNSPSGWFGCLNASGVGVAYLGDSATSGKTSIANIAYDDLWKVVTKASKLVHATGKFYFSTYAQDCMRGIKTTTGYPLFAQLPAEVPSTVVGRPFETSVVLPGLADDNVAGQPFLIYGDLKRCTMFGNRHDVEIAFSDIPLFNEGGMSIRVLSRFAFIVTLPAGIAVLKTANS